MLTILIQHKVGHIHLLVSLVVLDDGGKSQLGFFIDPWVLRCSSILSQTSGFCN